MIVYNIMIFKNFNFIKIKIQESRKSRIPIKETMNRVWNNIEKVIPQVNIYFFL